MVDIMVMYPGASAQQVSNMAIQPLERMISEIPGVKHVYSASQRGQGIVTVQFDVGEDMGPSLVKVNDKLSSNMDKIPPGVMPPKTDPVSRPMKGVAPLMIAIVTAQEIRRLLGDETVRGATCTQWIDRSIAEIERDFFKPDLGALMEVVAPNGDVIDHFDGRTLNPGHAIECAWFILHEAKLRRDARMQRLGLAILDLMWRRGWDPEFGGLLYFTDIHGKPVQEYWAEMKFWWPHNEAEIATLLAYQITGEKRYAEWHGQVHAWSRRVFADPDRGEWFGYAHRDGRISTRLKGNLWKGPFHLPRMLWYNAGLVRELQAAQA
jgi:N-acylglucosamine 2-epimerase